MAAPQDALLGDARRLERRGDAAVAQDQHAVGDMDELRQVAGIEQDRVALGGEVAHQLEDLALGADVDAARRIVEQEHARLGEQHLAEDHLLLVAARQRAGELLGRLGLDAQEVASSRRPAPPRVAASRRPQREKRGMTESVRFSRTLFGEEQALAAAVLRHQRDAVAAVERLRAGCGSRPACPRARRAASTWPTPNSAWNSSRWPCPCRPPTPSTSPSCRSRSTPCSRCRRRGRGPAARCAAVAVGMRSG